jgi:hypothetical protein
MTVFMVDYGSCSSKKDFSVELRKHMYLSKEMLPHEEYCSHVTIDIVFEMNTSWNLGISKLR